MFPIVEGYMAMSAKGDKLRIGVIGAGWFASRRHLPDIERKSEVQLAALCRRDPNALRLLSDRFHPEKTYTDWREMLSDHPMNAVLIATPHNLHFEPAREALTRGLHVLLEKPMTATSEEARTLCNLAESRGLTLAVALNPPFWAHCHRIRDSIISGSIGDLEAMSMYWTGNAAYVFGEAPKPDDLPGAVPPTMFRSDPEACAGGYLTDGGSHLISEVLWTSGRRAVKVNALMDDARSDRRTLLSLELDNGAMASISCIGDSQSGARRVRNTFGGSKGTITVEGFDFATTIERTDKQTEHFTEKELEPLPGPVANFVDAVKGRAPLFSPSEHGLHVVEVVEAAYRSATTGSTVVLQQRYA